LIEIDAPLVPEPEPYNSAAVIERLSSLFKQIVATQVTQHLSNPSNSVPEPPAKNAPIERWFEYYVVCKYAGFKRTQKQIAQELGISHGHFRTEYMKWRAEHMPDAEIE
jgi:hypothetical protein